ncbi:peptidoglycan editing factor PgeF [Candidatus Beckwithbacteria bacterium CG10_big_fil_rev_8_21_14_0_10_34_10]|uniref:Purine nucleoside phosphorylase n=1 Tax=Candidatus Beckwithbacteria bacterium CG10_big_fil_rev_8_21_14_0_10_34_10 TaxID=1974495 RepID=A0A2H0W926_9BACT|nr:MAG: peptidoglycan editing factor PgeF [Candidatus Beckwithbacteria bacterium CG10_big_fil_rev_8_21_14_0_10_34_10]
MSKNEFLQFKKLKKFSHLTAAVFPRSFGNVSYKYGLKKEVLKNRQKIAKSLKINLNQIIEMDQVHGSQVKIIKTVKSIIKPIASTDGLVTNKRNVFLMVKTADCLPVFFYDPKNKVIAMVHLGWRGAIEKIFLETLFLMATEFNSNLKDIIVALGPGIKACCFRHRSLVQSKLPEWKDFIKKERNGLVSLDLSSFLVSKLQSLGIKRDNIEVNEICTCCSKNYFSHFRELKNKEKKGRFASLIGLRE